MCPNSTARLPRLEKNLPFISTWLTQGVRRLFRGEDPESLQETFLHVHGRGNVHSQPSRRIPKESGTNLSWSEQRQLQGGADSLRAGGGQGGGWWLQPWDQGSENIFFSKRSTQCKKAKVVYLFFLFGPEVSHKYWTHWFNHVEVIRTCKSKVVFLISHSKLSIPNKSWVELKPGGLVQTDLCPRARVKWRRNYLSHPHLIDEMIPSSNQVRGHNTCHLSC